MVYLLRLMLGKKLWVVIAFFSMTFSAGFTIIQANIIAKIFTATVDIRGVDSDLVVSSKNEVKKSFWQNLKELISVYFSNGSQQAIKYIIDTNSVLLIIAVVGILLFITFVFQFFSYFKDVSNEYLSMSSISKLREETVLKMIDLPYSYYKKNNTGMIITKLFDDLNNSRTLMVKILEGGVYGPIIGVMAFISLLSISYKFIFIAGFILVVVAIIINVLSFFLKKSVYRVQNKMESILNKIQSIIYGIEIVKIFNQKKNEKKHFFFENEKYQKFNLHQIMIAMLNRPILEFFTYMTIAFILLYISFLVWNGEMVFGDMIGIFMLGIFTIPYIQRFGTVFLLKKQVDVYVERILKIINERSENEDEGRHEITSFEGNVQFKDVNFFYGKKQILKNINFDIKSGEFVALVGLSGAGKSTISNLLSSFLNIHSGNIFFGKHDLKEISLEERRRYISLVSQDNILFPMSIYDNILYANKKATHEEVIEVSRKAYCHDFIESLEDGYDTILSDMGKSISGGQKQRICLARAILKKSKILILDEATSSLDSHSEQMIQKTIGDLKGERTLVVIAHRMSTIRQADKVIVLDKGNVIEVGNHESLMKKKGLYKNFVDIQGSF